MLSGPAVSWTAKLRGACEEERANAEPLVYASAWSGSVMYAVTVIVYFVMVRPPLGPM